MLENTVAVDRRLPINPNARKWLPARYDPTWSSVLALSVWLTLMRLHASTSPLVLFAATKKVGIWLMLILVSFGY